MSSSEVPAEAASHGLPPSIAWEPSAALFGLVLALPTLVIGLLDLASGLALGAGVLPAAGAGLPAGRQARLGTLLIGILAGGCLLAGSVLAQHPALAVAGLFALGPASAWLATRLPGGIVFLLLGPAFVGIGFSLVPAQGMAAAILMSAGSVYAFALSRFWPRQAAGRQRPAPSDLQPPHLHGYGIRLGVAGAAAAAIGFWLELEHVGWACGAALLVMRPSAELVLHRALGRAISVTMGALGAAALSMASAPAWVVLTVGAGAIAAIAGTRHSRWYITPGFTTFFVFLLLLAGQPQDAPQRFNERVIETALGVTLAIVLGALLPRLLHSRPPHDQAIQA